MNALEQLKELSALRDPPYDYFRNWKFLYANGPALVELIEAAMRIELGCSFPANDVERTIVKVLRPILAKLTEDKP